MACQLRAIGEDGVAANLTIMGQMDVCHDPVVIPYAGCAFVMDGSNVEGAKFADRVSMANDQFTWFTVVFFVLRNRAQRVELKNGVVTANGGTPLDHTMRPNAGSSSNADMRSNRGEWPHANRRVQFSFRIDDRRRVNGGHGSIDAPHGAHQVSLDRQLTAHQRLAIEFENPCLHALKCDFEGQSIPRFNRPLKAG